MENFNIKKVKWLKDFYGNPTAYYPLRVPGVTTVLGDMIVDPDYLKFVEEVGEEKAKQITEAAWHRGTSMHAFIENFLKDLAATKDPTSALRHTQQVTPALLEKEGVPMDRIDKGREMFFSFYHSDYANAYIDLIGTELSLYSQTLFFRGKTDVFYNEKGVGRVVTDFKTVSKPIQKGSIKELVYKRQLGAYALAIEEMLKDKDVKVQKASILAVNTKRYLLQEIVCEGLELEEQKNEFSKLVKQWHIKNNQGFLFEQLT